MHVVAIRSYFKKMDLVTFCNLKADLTELFVDWFGEYHSSIFCNANKMIEQYGNIVFLVNIDTHQTSLSRSKLRGIDLKNLSTISY